MYNFILVNFIFYYFYANYIISKKDKRIIMASELRNLSSISSELPDASYYRVGIVVSEYHNEITEKLLEGALEVFRQQNVQQYNLYIEYAPGAFELPLACQRLMRWHRLDGIIALGCVIKGDTEHDKYINHSVADALQTLQLNYGKPICFGVLTPNTMEQAEDRAGGIHGNKGVEVAAACLKMIAIEKRLERTHKQP